MFPQPLVSVLHVKDLVHEEKYDPKWDVVLAGLVDRGADLEVAGQVTYQNFFRFASFGNCIFLKIVFNLLSTGEAQVIANITNFVRGCILFRAIYRESGLVQATKKQN